MTTPKPRPGVLDIAAYAGGESKIDGFERVIKLSSNEGALGPSDLAVNAMTGAARGVHRYPDGGAAKLRAAIAEVHGLDADRIVCGAGSDEIISLLCQAYVGAGDETVYSEHGFMMYAISTKAAGGVPVMAKEENLTANVDNLLAAVTDKTRIMFIANPNNPTGTWLPRSELERLRARLREDVLLVIDGAYAEYMSDPDYEPGAALAGASDNTVMTRTFSKIYAMGGARLGWGYAPETVADALNRVRGPFNVSAPALAGGAAAVRDLDFIERSRAHNDEWLKRTRDAMRLLGLETPDGRGNFILVRFPDVKGQTAADADGYLKSRGVIVRRVAGYGLPDCLRVTIGAADEMELFIAHMRTFMGGT